MKTRGPLSLEEVLTSSRGFGLVEATPLQRAICRIVDGVPLGELAAHPDVVAAIGDASALPVDGPPLEVSLYSAIRTAKSMTAAAAAVCASQRVDVSRLKPGDPAPRVAIVAPREDLARATFHHLAGAVSASPVLRRLLIGEPLSDSLMLRHPSGRAIEVCTSPASSSGTNVTARWLAGLIVDEAPRMPTVDEGAAITLEDLLTSARGRLLPGAPLLKIGTPTVAAGLAYREVSDRWGKPSRDLVVIRGRGPALNPAWWTSERCDDLRRRDPRAYERDVEANFVAAMLAAFDPDLVAACFRAAPADLARAERVGLIDLSDLRGKDETTWGVGGFAWPRRSENDATSKLSVADLHAQMQQNGRRPLDVVLGDEGQVLAVNRVLEDRGNGVRIEWTRDGDQRAIDRDRACFVVDEVAGFGGAIEASASSRIFDDMARMFRRHGVKRVFGDARNANWASTELTQRGFIFEAIYYGADLKARGVEVMRRWLAGRRLVLPTHDKLCAQLLRYQTKLSTSGVETFAGRGRTAVDDYVSLLVLGAILDAESRLPDSPTRTAPSRGVMRHWPAP